MPHRYHWDSTNGLHDRAVLIQLYSKDHDVWITVVGGHVRFRHPDALAMAEGFIDRGEPIQPLLDWAVENIELTGHTDWGKWIPSDEGKRKLERQWLKRAICIVTGQQEGDQ